MTKAMPVSNDSRLQILLSPEVKALLADASRRTGLSISALVRLRLQPWVDAMQRERLSK